MLNTFYNSCEILEDLVCRQNNFVWIAADERARQAQTRLTEIHIEFQRDAISGVGGPSAAKQKFDAEKAAITKYYTDEEYFYAPAKITSGLQFHLQGLQTITSTTCGTKLKFLASV